MGIPEAPHLYVLMGIPEAPHLYVLMGISEAPHLYVLMGIPEAYLVHYIELDLRFLNYGEFIVVYRIRIILFTSKIYLVSVV